MQPKKSLSQNFLTNPKIADAIVAAGNVDTRDVVLEIGPGKGVLTERLLAVAGKVIAVEKDDTLFALLKEKFTKEIAVGKLVLVNEDILCFDPLLYNLQPAAYKLIANIPYNITGAIVRKFLEIDCQPSQMVLLVQKEVGERIIAQDGKESLLSISVKVYGIPKLLTVVRAGNFFPKPKVDSAILKIDNISKQLFRALSFPRRRPPVPNGYVRAGESRSESNLDPRFHGDDTSTEHIKHAFFTLLHAGFAHKRKLLIRNLGDIVTDKKTLEAAFIEAGISLKSRSENLSPANWRDLFIKLKKNGSI